MNIKTKNKSNIIYLDRVSLNFMFLTTIMTFIFQLVEWCFDLLLSMFFLHNYNLKNCFNSKPGMVEGGQPPYAFNKVHK